MADDKLARQDYEFSVRTVKGTCTCNCPCNPSNPVDVTVVVSSGAKVAEAFTIGPNNVKQLS